MYGESPPQGQQYQPNQPMYPPPPQPYNANYNNNAAPDGYQQAPPNYGNQYANSPQHAEEQPYPHNKLPFEKEEGGNVKGLRAWKDVWALVLWILNMGAFIGLSVLALEVYSQNHATTTGGVTSSTQYGGLTFDTSTFKIFGLSAVVGFGLSLLYLILVNT
jgi:hypothetical protein